MNHRYTKGFTLIELLVVVGIISLLASVVLVSLQSARVRANNIAFVSQLKDLQSALFQYKLNHNDQLPPCPSPSSFGAASPITCYDLGGFSWLDEALAPLVNDQLINKVPHYAGWPRSAMTFLGGAWSYIQYLPNIYNYGGDPAVEFSCDPFDYANWQPGTNQLPGILMIISSETLPLPLGYTQCDVTGGGCFYDSGTGSGRSGYTYCLPLDYK